MLKAPLIKLFQHTHPPFYRFLMQRPDGLNPISGLIGFPSILFHIEKECQEKTSKDGILPSTGHANILELFNPAFFIDFFQLCFYFAMPLID